MTTIKIWDGNLSMIEELYNRIFDDKFDGYLKECNIADVIEEALFALKASIK